MDTDLHKLARVNAFNRGFTLVEVVATLVILAILAAVAVPRMFDSQTLNQRGYIDEVASALRYAQRIAIASNCQVSVVIGAAGYAASQRDTEANCNNSGAPWTTPVRHADGSTLSGTAPGEITMDPVATIVFDGKGIITSGNPPAFAVGPFTLTIDVASGRVTVTP
jgi:prepilin-type N-terminal cleavage/methylation domain-containing protein